MTTPSQQFCGGKRSNTPVGIYAASRVQRAILRGELVRPDVCSINDDECSGRIEGHHWHGYDEEHILDVQWLCVTHHRRLHGAEVAERNKARQTGGAGLAFTAHPADADSPGLLVGITGRSSLLLLPDGPRCAPIRAAGGWRGLSEMEKHFQVCHDRHCPTCARAHDEAVGRA